MFSLSSLFGPGFKIAPATARAWVRVALALAALLLLLVGFMLRSWMAGGLPGDDPRSDLQVLAGVLVLRAPVALALGAAALILSALSFRLVERSRLGHQLLRWRDGNQGDKVDPENVPAARTLGAFILLAALFLGTAGIFAAVLR